MYVHHRSLTRNHTRAAFPVLCIYKHKKQKTGNATCNYETYVDTGNAVRIMLLPGGINTVCPYVLFCYYTNDVIYCILDAHLSM